MAEAHERIVPVRLYVIVLAALLALLALTTWLGFVNLDQRLPGHAGWNTGVAVVIAVVKALLVILYFMHVRHASRLTWVFAAAGFLWLGIMLSLTMSDYVTRNRPAGVNPKGEPRLLEPIRPARV
jgi:cytochrome c oxidase subunit 4